MLVINVQKIIRIVQSRVDDMHFFTKRHKHITRVGV